MLKLEPREADVLPVPSRPLVEASSKNLAAIRPQVASMLSSARLIDAAKLVDEILLVGELGMKRSEVRLLREAHAEYTARRVARSTNVSNR